jgi:hypothetical protein
MPIPVVQYLYIIVLKIKIRGAGNDRFKIVFQHLKQIQLIYVHFHNSNLFMEVIISIIYFTFPFSG